jgi:SAM-dependent methyltransferase
VPELNEPLGSEVLAPGWIAPDIDTSTATPARMYDYYLGGKDNFAADRAAAEEVLRVIPEVRDMARANRALLGRMVRTLAESGVRQFLDIGIGLPGAGGTGETARSVHPDAVVVGVDNDPIVLAHARARATSAGPAPVLIVSGDVRDPAAILADPRVRAELDFDQPVAVLLVAILHFVADAEDPVGIISTLMDAVPAGSHLVVTHVTGDFDQARLDASARAYDKATARLAVRSLKEITAFFDGLDLLEPGIVQLPWWRPDGAVPAGAEKIWMYGGVGRKG